MAQSSFGYFGFGKETVEGTDVDPTVFMPVKDVNFEIDNQAIEFSEIRGNRQAYSNFDGPLRPSASFTSALYPHESTGMLLRGLFGAVTSAVDAPSATVYEHTFNDAASLPSFSLERSDTRTLGTGNLFQRLNGAKVESIGFTASFGEDVEMRVAMQALDFPTTPAAKPASFTNIPTMDPFLFSGAAVKVDGVANNYFKSIDFEFTNTLEPQETLRGARTAYRIYEGGLSCSVSGTMAFEDQAMYDKLEASEYLTLDVIFAGATIDAPNSLKYGLEFHWPKLKVQTLGLPMTAGEVIEADVSFLVSFDFVTNRIVNVVMRDLDDGSGW